MITRSSLTLQTPGTLILGIATEGHACAITGSIRTITGEVVTEVVESVGVGLWHTLHQALEDVRACRARYLIIATSSDEVIKFFTPPINMQPTTKTTVPPLNKTEYDEKSKRWVPCKPSVVPTGGNNDQWSILRLLFAYDCWKVVKLEKLPNTERLLKSEPKRTGAKSA